MATKTALDLTDAGTFHKEAFFCYNQARKKQRAFFLFGFFLFVTLILFVHFAGGALLPETITAKITQAYKSVSGMTKHGDIRGAAILFFAGSLFFFFMPLEVLFLTYLANGATPYELLPTVIAVIIVSHTINYSIGQKMDAVSKMIISPKKFYRLKGLLNHYGPLLILAVNALPLSSPVLSAILGTFRYRRARFYFYVISGQTILYSALILIHHFILKGTGL